MAEERAANECTIDYNSISDYYDINANMWRIDFMALERTEDGRFIVNNRQSVYLDSKGVTQLVVYHNWGDIEESSS